MVLLSKAEASIDDKEYDIALGLYRRALAAMESDKESKNALQDLTLSVYKKLHLHQQLDKAAIAIEKKQRKQAQEALKEVQRLAGEIGQQSTPLIQDATKAYARLVKTMNALAIEDAARY